MGRIPEFTRTILPDRSVGLAGVQASRAQADIDAQNIEQNRNASQALQNKVTDYRLRDLEAKNTTWTNENVIEYKRQMSERLDQMRQERSGSPENFRKDFDKEMKDLADDFAKKAPSANAQQAIRGSMTEIRSRAFDTNIEWERRRKAEMYAESIERGAESLNVMSLRRGQNGESIDDLLNDADASAVAGSTIVSGPEKVAQIRDTMREGIITNYIEGLSEKRPGEAKKLLNSGKYDDDLEADQIQRLQGVIDSQIERNKAKVRLEINDDLKEFDQAARLGLKVPDTKINELIEKTSSAGMDKQTEQLRQYAQIQDDISEFAVQPLDEQRQQLEDIKRSIEEGGSLGSVPKYAALSEVYENKIKTIKTDPYAYYAAHNIIREPEPIDFSDAQGMAEEMQQRRTSVQQVADLDGVNLPLFTPQEIDRLKDVYDRASPTQAGALLQSFDTSLSPLEKQGLAQAIEPKSQILSAAIAVDDPITAATILSGSKAKGEVSAGDFRVTVNEELGGAITDPVALETAHEAIFAHYKQSALSAGDVSDAVDERRLTKSIEAVLGPVSEVDTKRGFGGVSKILSYRDHETKLWKSEDELNDILNGITDDILANTAEGIPIGPGGNQWTAEKVLNEGRFVSSGDGKYNIFVDGLNGGTDYIANKKMLPYTIDARELETLYRKNPKRAKYQTQSIREGF